MKDLEDFINEAYSNDVVFVVKDTDGSLVGVYDTKEDAEKAKEEFEITPDMKATISTEKRSDYMDK